jgi:uncharacterized SAM-binding protein YcdF (DUF218 family)
MPVDFLFKKLLTSLILPPTGPLLLALLFLLLHLWQMRRAKNWLDVSRRVRLPSRLLPALALCCVLSVPVLSLPAVSLALMAQVETMPPISPAQLREIDAIVILGGGLYHEAPEFTSDTVNPVTLERLRYGARLARESFRPVLVSGGAPAGGQAEADAMRWTLAQDFGIDARWVEAASIDTAGNARESARILFREKMTRIALVSHASHLPRAVPLFAAEGLTVTPAPLGFTTTPPLTAYLWMPSTQGLHESRRALHEMLGRWLDKMKGIAS